MAKIRIVYGSETGNTESIAELVRDELKNMGHEVNCESAGDVPADGLGNGYDCVLLGTSIWGIDEVELQSDFEAYDGNFESMGLEGKPCAAFTSGVNRSTQSAAILINYFGGCKCCAADSHTCFIRAACVLHVV